MSLEQNHSNKRIDNATRLDSGIAGSDRLHLHFASPSIFDEQFILEVEELPPDANEHMLYALDDGVMKELETLVDVTTRDGNTSEGDS